MTNKSRIAPSLDLNTIKEKMGELPAPRHKFEVIIPIIPPDAYYIFRGKQVTEKEFAKRQFEELMITDESSSVHTSYLTPAEVLEKFSDLLTREQIEKLKSDGSI